MNVLITPHFNLAMRSLTKEPQKEVSSLYTLATSLSREQLESLPLLTKLESAEGIYSLRGSHVRIFCSFDQNDNVLFLNVEQVASSPRPSPKQDEVTLFGQDGEPVAYIDTRDEHTIYAWDGRPLAYVDEKSAIYGFNGQHLGWFEDGIVWDIDGRRVGYTTETSPTFTRFEPFKRFKRFKPFKRFKRFAKFKRFKKRQSSDMELLTFLEQGKV